MYTFKATYTHLDDKGRVHYDYLRIDIDLNPYDHEDFEGMNAECFAFVQAVKKAYKYSEDHDNLLLLKIEFISC